MSRVEQIRERWAQEVGPPYGPGPIAPDQFIAWSREDIKHLLSRLDAAEKVVEMARGVANWIGKECPEDEPSGGYELVESIYAYDQSRGASDG